MSSTNHQGIVSKAFVKVNHTAPRPGLMELGIRNPFGDSAGHSKKSSLWESRSQRSTTSLPRPEDHYNEKRPRHRFRSYRLTGKFEQPWLKDPRMRDTRHNSWIVYGGIVIGILLSAYICFTQVQNVTNHEYCLILDDNFETLDPNVWTHEVQIDGFGSGSFDWTTTDAKNTFTDAEGLHIVPTLTNETTDINNDHIYNGYTLNLTSAGGDGSCTSTSMSSCSIRSNSTLGDLIPPVRSARLTTVGKKTIKYGKVEVTAKFPRGDWLWPAIWMFPQDRVYGEWPRSGEIDLAECRGNSEPYVLDGIPSGRNVITSTLHWGASTLSNAYWRTTNGKALRRTDFTKEFHTFGVEWSEDYIYTYMDSRLIQVLFVNFKTSENMWERGNFSTQVENGTFLENPWQNTTTHNAPFDVDFYLILNVAVGSRNGWFKDGVGGKPWVDGATNAAWDFWNAADSWLPTWGEGAERGMTVKNVKMWQQGKCA